MINSFKQFENNSDSYYIIIDMVRGNIEHVEVFDKKESAYNYVRNFVHENISTHSPEDYDDIEDEFDPDELLEYFNDRNAPDYEVFLKGPHKLSNETLNSNLELRMNSNKYNL